MDTHDKAVNPLLNHEATPLAELDTGGPVLQHTDDCVMYSTVVCLHCSILWATSSSPMQTCSESSIASPKHSSMDKSYCSTAVRSMTHVEINCQDISPNDNLKPELTQAAFVIFWPNVQCTQVR